MTRLYFGFFLSLLIVLSACGGGSKTDTSTASSAATPAATTAPVIGGLPSILGTPVAPSAGGVVPTPNPSAPPEVTLAGIQKRSPVDATDPLVPQFAQQLNALEQKCPGRTRQALAEDANAINQSIVSGGVRESLLETITGIDNSIPAGSQQPCQQAFAAYAASRLKSP